VPLPGGWQICGSRDGSKGRNSTKKNRLGGPSGKRCGITDPPSGASKRERERERGVLYDAHEAVASLSCTQARRAEGIDE
jgi:hypothetical protein